MRDEAVYLEIESKGPRGRELEERLISKLGLKHFPNKTLVGDIYSDGEDIIYYWLRDARAGLRSRRAGLLGCASAPTRAMSSIKSAVPMLSVPSAERIGPRKAAQDKRAFGDDHGASHPPQSPNTHRTIRASLL